LVIAFAKRLECARLWRRCFLLVQFDLSLKFMNSVPNSPLGAKAVLEDTALQTLPRASVPIAFAERLECARL